MAVDEAEVLARGAHGEKIGRNPGVVPPVLTGCAAKTSRHG
jgi:hypothetical protein